MKNNVLIGICLCLCVIGGVICKFLNWDNVAYIFSILGGGGIASFVIAKFVVGQEVEKQIGLLEKELNKKIVENMKLKHLSNCKVELENNIKNKLYSEGLIPKDKIQEAGGIISTCVQEYFDKKETK